MAEQGLGNIPRYCIHRGFRCRVLRYDDGRFLILTKGDEQRWVSRNDIILLPDKKGTP